MTLPFALGSVPLPEWLPWWVPAVLLIPLGLYLLLALLMPFGTFGVKSRLDDIEMQLDELRDEIRELAQGLRPSDQAFARDSGPRPPAPSASPARGVDARAAGMRSEPRLGPR